MITVGFPPSITATTELVVPKSIPTDFAILTPCFWTKMLMPSIAKMAHGRALVD
jgi:hypothetical protein